MPVITVSFDIDTADATDVQRAVELAQATPPTTITVPHAKTALLIHLKALTNAYRKRVAQAAVAQPSDPSIT